MALHSIVRRAIYPSCFPFTCFDNNASGEHKIKSTTALPSFGSGTLHVFKPLPLPLHMVFERFWVRPPHWCSPHTVIVIWFSTDLPWCRGTRSCSNSSWPPSQTQGRHLDPVSYTWHSSPVPPRGLLIGNRRWTTQHKSQDPPLRPTLRCHFL